MPDYPLIPLDQLNPVTPSRNHVLAAMLTGEAGALSVGQILSLIAADDIDDSVVAILKAIVAKALLADADKILGLDSENSDSPIFVTLAHLIDSIFKTTRKITNANFDGLTLQINNAANKALLLGVAALTASRTITMPDADVDLARVNKMIGYDQSWTDVSGSRAASTSYQNTTGRPIEVAMRAVVATARTVEVSSNGTVWATVAVMNSTDVETASFIVPNSWYYRINGAITSISIWMELR